jgi:hypothetical protein
LLGDNAFVHQGSADDSAHRDTPAFCFIPDVDFVVNAETHNDALVVTLFW